MPIDPTRPLGFLPLPSQSTVRPMFRTLAISASGLAAQRQRMETFAQNIANADVTRAPDGQPYRRRDVVLESANSQNAVFGDQGMGTGIASTAAVFGAPSSISISGDDLGQDRIKPIEVPVLPQGTPSIGPNTGEHGVRVVGVAEDQGMGRVMYEPTNPDADEHGYVRYPDIDTTQELVKLLEAKRLYEANAAAFQTAKSILRASIDI